METIDNNKDESSKKADLGNKSPFSFATEREFPRSEVKSDAIAARGGREGLIITVNGKYDWEVISHDISQFLELKKDFLANSNVNIKWLNCQKYKSEVEKFIEEVQSTYLIQINSKFDGISSEVGVAASKKKNEISQNESPSEEGENDSIKEAQLKSLKSNTGERSLRVLGSSSADDLEDDSTPKKLDLFGTDTNDINYNQGNSLKDQEMPKKNRDNVVSILDRKVPDDISATDYLGDMAKVLGEDVGFGSDANAKVMIGTVRSGQKIETPHSLIVIGDVNPGADLIAGGDIIVLGSLRGTAHASAYDDTDYSSVIIASQMRPMQLRIGSIISRGSTDVVDQIEIAHVDGDMIFVESYSSKLVSSLGLDNRRGN